MVSRRDFGKSMLAAIPAARLFGNVAEAAAIDSRINGVRMALQSACFTFSGMGIDDIVKTMTDVGLAEIDVMVEHVEAYLGARGYMVLVELRTGDPTVTFRLEQEGRRCSLLARRDTLMREDLEELLAAPGLEERLQEEAVVALEDVAR